MSDYVIQSRRNSESTEWLDVTRTNSLIEARQFVNDENSEYTWIKYRVAKFPLKNYTPHTDR